MGGAEVAEKLLEVVLVAGGGDMVVRCVYMRVQ